MKTCHVCLTECEDFEELCPLCGAILKTEEEKEEISEDLEQVIVLEKPVLLASFDDIISAEIFKDILKDNGIPYSCDAAGEEGTLRMAFGGAIMADDVYVDECDFEEADKLYNEFLENPPEISEDFFADDFFIDELSEEE